MGVGRGSGLGGRDDFHEFRVGRIKHERVKVRHIATLINALGYAVISNTLPAILPAIASCSQF